LISPRRERTQTKMAADGSREGKILGEENAVCEWVAHAHMRKSREGEREWRALGSPNEVVGLAWLACRIHEIQIHLSDCVRSSNETVVSAECGDLKFLYFRLLALSVCGIPTR